MSERNGGDTVNSKAEKGFATNVRMSQFGGYIPCYTDRNVFNIYKKRMISPYAAIREWLDNSLAVGDFPGFNATEAFLEYNANDNVLEFLDNGVGMAAEHHAKALNMTTASDATGALISQFGIGMKEALCYFSGHAVSVSVHKTAAGIERSAVLFGEDTVNKVAACLCLVIPEGFMEYMKTRKNPACWNDLNDYHTRVAPSKDFDENQDKEAAIEYIDEWTKNGLNLKTMCRDSYLENFRANAPICTPFNTLQDLLDCFETIENQKDGQTDGTGTLLRMWLRPERKFQVADDGSLQVLAPENAAWEDLDGQFKSNYPYLHPDLERLLRPSIFDPINNKDISFEEYEQLFKDHGGFKFSIQGKPVQSVFDYQLYPTFFAGRENEPPSASVIKDSDGHVIARVVKSIAKSTLEHGLLQDGKKISSVLMGGTDPDKTIKSHKIFRQFKDPLCTVSLYKGNRALGKPRDPPGAWTVLRSNIANFYTNKGLLYSKEGKKVAKEIKELKESFGELCGSTKTEKDEIIASLSSLDEKTFENRFSDLLLLAGNYRMDVFVEDPDLNDKTNATKTGFCDEGTESILIKQVYRQNFEEEWARVQTELGAERAAAAARAAVAAQDAAEKRAQAQRKRLIEESRAKSAAEALAGLGQNLSDDSGETQQLDAGQSIEKFADEAETPRRDSGACDGRLTDKSKSAKVLPQKRKLPSHPGSKTAKRIPNANAATAGTSPGAGPSSTPAGPSRKETTAPRSRTPSAKGQSQPIIAFEHYRSKQEEEFHGIVEALKKHYTIPQDCDLFEALSGKFTIVLGDFQHNMETSGIDEVTFPITRAS